jgi:hypothetical protein
MATKNYSLPQWNDGEEFKVIAQLNLSKIVPATA